MTKLLSLAVVSAALLWGCQEKIHKFEGVEGPLVSSQMVPHVPASPSDFDVGSDSRLALLLIEEDSHWLSLVLGLRTIGIPFQVTQDYQEAVKHDVVLVYPHISGRDIKPEALRGLAKYALEGGTLIGTNVLGGGLEKIFGFESLEEGKNRSHLKFSTKQDETVLFEEKGLTSIKFASAMEKAVNPGSNTYVNPDYPPLAVYENGGAAFIENTPGKGKTYALGVDIGQMLAKGYNWRQVDITESYANEYQPILDAFLIFLENIYRQNQPHAVTLGTVPYGKKLSFILSHDVDYSQSLKNAVDYAKHEASEGIEATYFVQAKYIEDFNDSIFFDEEGAEYLKTLKKLGMEIASHSVSHSLEFDNFPLGTGTESYPNYRPFVRNKEKTYGASIFGELRVSKFLFEYFLKDQEVVSFRPGYLRNPYILPQSLESTGYQYSSSVTANMSLTHLPFQLTYERGFTGLTDVFEIPITIEDEILPIMYERIDRAKKVARRIAEIEGVMVVLIHTDAVDDRLKFQKELVDEVKPYAWMGSMRQFGNWWSARDKIEVDVAEENGEVVISLRAPKAIKGLTLELSGEYDIVQSSIPLEQLILTERKLLIEELSGVQTIILND